MDLCPNGFVQTHSTPRVLQCKLWFWGDNNMSSSVNKCITVVEDVEMGRL